MHSPGSIIASPNPVREGQSVTISYTGRRKVYYAIDHGSSRELVFDDNDEATIRAPVGATSIVVYDEVAKDSVVIDVLSSSEAEWTSR